MREIKRLKLLTMKPPIFQDSALEYWQRQLFADKIAGRGKGDFCHEMNERITNRILLEIIVDKLPPAPKCSSI